MSALLASKRHPLGKELLIQWECVKMDKAKSDPRFWYSHPADIERVMDSIGDDDVVLEVGGGFQPLSRADYVADSVPYSEKNLISVKGWSTIHFSRETWATIDLSSQPLPFEDNSVDYVFCSHTLSRLRDPIFLCSEIVRVGRRGFVDFPSKWIECQKNVDAGNLSEYYSGYINHRWLIDASVNHLVFTPKTPLSTIVSYEKTQKTRKYMNSPRIWSSSFFWEREFAVEETPVTSAENVLEDLKQYFTSFDYLPYREELKGIRLNQNLNSETHDKMLVQAWQHHKSGKYHLAIQLLRGILHERPDNVDAQALLGVSAGAAAAMSRIERPECRKTELASV
jgi:hypothetical protein